MRMYGLSLHFSAGFIKQMTNSKIIARQFAALTHDTYSSTLGLFLCSDHVNNDEVQVAR